VDAAQIQIRRLTPADAALYRDIRLEGLRRNPEAFGSTFEAETAKPLTFFSERLGGSAAFGAFHDSELVGIAGLLIRDGRKEAHKGLLVGMYVRPSARKAGVGRRLVETIIEFARQRSNWSNCPWSARTSKRGGYTNVWASWNMESKRRL